MRSPASTRSGQQSGADADSPLVEDAAKSMAHLTLPMLQCPNSRQRGQDTMLVYRPRQMSEMIAVASDLPDPVKGLTETAVDYLARLREVFIDHSGMERPPNDTNQTPWEGQLTNCFMKGLRKDLAAATQQSCICWETQQLKEVLRHATHCEKQAATKILKTAQTRTKVTD
ncbi:hypothetical protein SKAU_G00280900 [Synaphobranchus kaupii]|uniref:Uncharacterized protein n=1 Tax=Synaphobranchus kaupii TaxID=118154 RepID=A0A9Q1IN03_SYNKA|nr:hypothetical protein SKAU_G00280900 [Synaphobranchus kaupii]